MRNRYIDLLRFLAIVRVVVYHTTGWALLTIAFPAMAVMFALAGSLMAASLDRYGPAAIGRRLRRLLPSLWVVAAIFVPAMLLTGLPVSWRLLLWVAPVYDTPSNGWGGLVLSVVWYLRDYLWFVLASPAALWLYRRAPVPTLLAPYVLLVVVELRFPYAPTVIRDFGLYFGAWLLGFAHHDGLLRRLPRAALLSIAATLAAFGAAWIVTHPGPRGYDLNDIRLGNGLWSGGFTLLLLGLAPATAAWVDRNALLRQAVTLVNRRALTVYLWHMPIVIGVAWLAAHTTYHLDLAVRLSAVATLVTVAVALFGWVEDLAARRRPALLPVGEHPVPSGSRPTPVRLTTVIPAQRPTNRTADRAAVRTG
jgi:peptidoglycan/LPS O-acetylase OafA/YrhL